MNVARETVELGNCDGAAERAGLSERRRQLWPTIESVASLSGFDLDNLGDDLFNPSPLPNRASAWRWASMPRPESPCWLVLTRM